MKNRYPLPALILLVLQAVPVSAQSTETRLATTLDVKKALEEEIKQFYPEARISRSERAFSAKANTMRFTVHPILRDGTISEKTRQEEGPKQDGFMLRVEYSKGRYTGPLVVPTTQTEAYWKTFLNEIYDEKKDSHLWVVYSYGSSVNKQFHTKIVSTLGKRPPPRRRN